MNGIILALLALLTAGTMANTPVPEMPTDEVEIVENITAPDTITVTDKVEGDNFTDKLYSIMPEDKNYMFSPFSVKSALAMAANGAEGKTKSEILDAVGINDLDAFNESMKEIIEKYTATDLLRFDISNSAWLNTDNANYGFSDSFADIVKTYYNGDVGKVNNENALPTINGWVKDKTQGKIPSIINDASFDAALVNAIYFEAKWENIFSQNMSDFDIFTDKNGKEYEIEFMNSINSYNYAEKDGVRVLEVKYQTPGSSDLNSIEPWSEEGLAGIKSLSMYILLSDNTIKNPESLVSELCENNLFVNQKMRFSIPKLKFEYSDDLSPVLKTLGINSAFSDASFEKMFGKKTNTAFSSFIHNTCIEFNGQGTKFVADEAFLLAGAKFPIPDSTPDFKANKPFTFLIRDNISGETFFIGEYAYAE